HIFSEIARLLLLALAEAFAGRHHEHDGNNAPCDAKHRKECPQLVRPQGSENVVNEIANGHSRLLGRSGTDKVTSALLRLDTKLRGILLPKNSKLRKCRQEWALRRVREV